jgi:hypothetical protein
VVIGDIHAALFRFSHYNDVIFESNLIKLSSWADKKLKSDLDFVRIGQSITLDLELGPEKYYTVTGLVVNIHTDFIKGVLCISVEISDAHFVKLINFNQS